MSPIIVLGLLAALTDTSSAGYADRVLLYGLESPDDLRALAQTVDEHVMAELSASAGLTVMSPAELRLLIAHEKDRHAFDECAQQQDECMARLASLGRADKLVTGRIGRWGDSGYLVILKLSDANAGTLERAESCAVESLEVLEEGVRGAADRLLGTSSKDKVPYSLDLASRPLEVAVLDLAAYDVRSDLAANVTELLALEMKRFEKTTVVTPADVRTMLAYEYDLAVLQGDDDVARLVEIGGALGVDYLVGGAVGLLEDTFVVHLKLIDISSAVVVHRVSESFRGPERDLGGAIRFAARSLVGTVPDGGGALVLGTSVDQATASIDTAARIDIPLVEPMSLGAGKHALSIGAEGYRTLHREFYVEPGAVTRILADLEPIPEQWYEQWWVWTLVGVAVAGGTTATVLMATDTSGQGGVGFR